MGAGKSTWCQRMVDKHGAVHCSRDKIRFSLLKDGEDYFSHEDEVLKLWFEEINNAIKNPEVKDVLIDATHLTNKARNKTIKELTKEVEYELIHTLFLVPLETCLERNAKRTGRAYVNETIIEKAYKSFEMPIEGKVIIANAEGKENI